jgi:hypothetical protein
MRFDRGHTMRASSRREAPTTATTNQLIPR